MQQVGLQHKPVRHCDLIFFTLIQSQLSICSCEGISGARVHGKHQQKEYRQARCEVHVLRLTTSTITPFSRFTLLCSHSRTHAIPKIAAGGVAGDRRSCLPGVSQFRLSLSKISLRRRPLLFYTFDIRPKRPMLCFSAVRVRSGSLVITLKASLKVKPRPRTRGCRLGVEVSSSPSAGSRVR